MVSSKHKNSRVESQAKRCTNEGKILYQEAKESEHRNGWSPDTNQVRNHKPTIKHILKLLEMFLLQSTDTFRKWILSRQQFKQIQNHQDTTSAVSRSLSKEGRHSQNVGGANRWGHYPNKKGKEESELSQHSLLLLPDHRWDVTSHLMVLLPCLPAMMDCIFTLSNQSKPSFPWTVFKKTKLAQTISPERRKTQSLRLNLQRMQQNVIKREER